MKTSRLASIAILGLALSLTPVYAQRGGGGRSGGGGHTSSSSVSRGGGHSSSSFSGSRSSSPSSSRSSFSGSSRSSSPSSSSRSSYSSPSSSRSSSPSSSRSSFSNSSRSSSPSSSRSSFSNSSRSSSPSVGGSRSTSVDRSSSAASRSSVPDQVRSRAGRGEAPATRGSREGGAPSRESVGAGRPGVGGSGAERKDGPRIAGRPSGTPSTPDGASYARPGHPGPMPPSHRPMHPAPYFWHPHHHCLVHCHPLYWDPFIPRPYYWPGFWHYGWTYWYDYHVTNIAVVRNYMLDTYKVDLITYAFSGDYMYALVNDPDGYTYIQVYDKEDHLLAEQRVNRRYNKMEIDPENGGCWIMKNRDKDPLLFLYTEEGKLLIYEAD